VLIPVYLMPLFFVFHLASLAKLRCEEFRNLALRTQSDYRKIIDKQIVPEFGDLPLAALSDRACRGLFKDWRDRLAARSRRQADYAWVVLARVLAVALDRGWIDVNPCEKGGRFYNQSRRDRIWTLEDEIAFLERALVTFILPSRWHSGQASGKVTYLSSHGQPMTATRSACDSQRPARG
jgi:hypothetical protein